MKKILLFLLLVFEISSCFAQDLIVLCDAQEIQAKVVNVSENEITYYKWDRLDGPTYSISVQKVIFIKYEDGSKDVFTINEVEEKNTYINHNAQQNQLAYDSKMYYYGDLSMTRGEYCDFLRENCPQAYKVYDSGITMVTTGWSLMSVGVVGCVTSLSIFLNSVSRTGSLSLGDRYLCIGFGAIGVGCEIACIPTLIVGYHKVKGSSVDIFNNSCKEKTPITLNAIAGSDGLGLALKF